MKELIACLVATVWDGATGRDDSPDECSIAEELGSEGSAIFRHDEDDEEDRDEEEDP